MADDVVPYVSASCSNSGGCSFAIHNSSESNLVMSDEKIGLILSSNPPIVERILSHLSVPQVNKCAQVCKLWHCIAQSIKKGRHKVFRMFKVCPLKDNCVDHHIDVEAPGQVYVAKCPSDISAHFYSILNNAPSEPLVALIFCSVKLCAKPHHYFPSYSPPPPRRKKKKKQAVDHAKLTGNNRCFYNDPMMDFLSRSLPPNCRTILCSAPGVIGTPVNNYHPVEVENLLGLSAVFFPHIPGVELYQFPIVSSCKSKKDDFDNFQLIPIKDDKPIKCLLLFFDRLPEQGGIIRKVTEHYLQEGNYKLALGGAFVEYFTSPVSTDCDTVQVGAGLAFAGDDVRAASIVLEPSIKTVDDVEAKLKLLKDCGFPEESCFGFMFACCARGVDFHGKPNIEADAFHKLFPTVPLFGTFGNGEIGINYLPQSSSKMASNSFKLYQKSKQTPSWFHGYTTVFVLISLKRSHT